MWAAQYLRNSPRKWISSAGLGTMGFGLPAAIGVKAALPNADVICIAGDASVLMNIQELGTLSQYDLNVKLIIINNRWQGMVRQWQESFYDERYSSSDMSCGEPDFVKLAESFGVKGYLISDRKQLQNELAKAKTYLSAQASDSNSQLFLNSNDVKKIFSDHQSNVFKIIDLLLQKNINESLIEINYSLQIVEPA